MNGRSRSWSALCVALALTVAACGSTEYKPYLPEGGVLVPPGTTADAATGADSGSLGDSDVAPPDVACRNINFDKNNCGACGHVCAGTLACVNADCVCSGGWYDEKNPPPPPYAACDECIGKNCCNEAQVEGVNAWGTLESNYKTCVWNNVPAATCEAQVFNGVNTDPSTKALYACIKRNNCPECFQVQ